ncbi:thioredoxin family protein [Arundinibacter roseus]|uniref:DUF255 domain-containing protein n=1 Tax=Arundinibacter roseus TaxID=2070510 RepID=A0A4R4KG42_9BACT|nr:DUF255 domain-containing protein [Arundinibacter roseus]TDB67000.1 DUF255 domain-containing protein [Arundinibacter roseus]
MTRIAYLLFFTFTLFSCAKKKEQSTQNEGNSAAVAATDLVPVTQEGVIFYANNVDKAFAAARAQNKPVFVEIYSESCHVCQSFIPIFKEKQVRDFYNTNFLNYKIEVNSPEFQSFVLARKIFVPSLPLLLYFDQNQNLTHLGMIEADAQKLIEQGQLAQNPQLRSGSMKKRFEEGEKNTQFLIDFAMFSKVTMDTVMNRKAMEIYAQQQPVSSYGSETNFLAIEKLLMDVYNPMGQYFIKNLPQFRKTIDPTRVKNVAENLVMSSLYSSFGAQYNSAKVLEIRDYLIAAEIHPQVAKNRILLPLINAYFREKAPGKAVAHVNTHLTQVQMKATDYAYLLQFFNDKCPDASYVASAQKWFENALTLITKNSAEEADLYYSMAVAQKRANNIAEAKKMADQALTIARNAKAETGKIDTFLRTI